MLFLSQFLNRSFTLASLKISGKHPVDREALHMTVIGLIKCVEQYLTSDDGILSIPQESLFSSY